MRSSPARTEVKVNDMNDSVENARKMVDGLEGGK